MSPLVVFATNLQTFLVKLKTMSVPKSSQIIILIVKLQLVHIDPYNLFLGGFKKMTEVPANKNFFQLIDTAFSPDNIGTERTFIPSKNSEYILDKRYYIERLRNEDGKIVLDREHSYAELCMRVSKVLSAFDSLYYDEETDSFNIDHIKNINKHMYHDMLNGRFLFNSPALFSAGKGITTDSNLFELIYKPIGDMTIGDYKAIVSNKNTAQMLSACFVIDVQDSIEGIYDGVKETAIISKFGGGVGINFSNLREKGAKIAGGIGGESSGAVSWLDDWNTMAKNVVQGGKRRAALMGMMKVDHPEIESFIDAKVKEGELSYFNLSVAFSDKFMKALDTENGEFDLLSRTPESYMQSIRKINAKTLWDKVCTSAWKKGDPGIFFIDSANRDNILKLLPDYNIIATNPCLSGDTPVTLRYGKTKPIKDIVVGDTVISYNELTNTLEEKTVTFSQCTKKSAEYMILEIDHNVRLKLTPDHKVFTTNRGYVKAVDLKSSDIPLTIKPLDIFEGEVSLAYNHGNITDLRMAEDTIDVYDINVEDNHNFFANNVLVHNCAEEPGWDGFCCVLGSINLSQFVKQNEDGKATFDLMAFVQQIHRSSYYLDLIPDASTFPTKRITESVRQSRPIGLGLMGLADLFIKSGITYGDNSSFELTDIIATVFGGTAMYSNYLRTRDKPDFPCSDAIEDLFTKNNFIARSKSDSSVLVQYFKDIAKIYRSDEGDIATCIPYTWSRNVENFGEVIKVFDPEAKDIYTNYEKEIVDFTFGLVNGILRNSRMMSIAPTGTISMILDASASIEPLFALTWDRLITLDQDTSETVTFYHPLLTPNDITNLQRGEKLGGKWVTSNELDVDAHLTPVQIFAKVIDSAISKTVNMPASATVQDVKDVYEQCYNSGIKGITIYRDKSRDNQPISDASKTDTSKTDTSKTDTSKNSEVKTAETKATDVPKLPEEAYVGPVKKRSSILAGLTEKANTPFGSMYMTANYADKEILECFIHLGKSGSEIRSMIEALSRVISIGLRSGTKIEDYITTLEGIAGSETWVYENAEGNEFYVRSIPDMIAKMLGNLNRFKISIGVTNGGSADMVSEKLADHYSGEDDLKCPECGSPNFRMESGCNVCPSCGYSKCK